MTGLSVIIVSWNTKDLLARCLESVCPTAEIQNLEVFVVDNGSTDGSACMAQQRFPWVSLIVNPENMGFARANNQGIVESQGRYVLLLNSDTEVYRGALEVLVQFMEEHPQAGGCGPLLLNADGSLQPSCHPLLTPGREFWRLLFLDQVWHQATYVQDRWNLQTPRQVEVIKGACLMLRQTALDQVGLLDEQYFMYSEEMDLCYRLAQAGWELWWVPQAIVTHYGEGSSKQMPEAMYIQLYRSKTQFYRKFGGPRSAEQFKRLIRLAYGPRLACAAIGSLFSPKMGSRARLFRRLLSELPSF